MIVKTNKTVIRVLVTIFLANCLLTFKVYGSDEWPKVREFDLTIGVWLNARQNHVDVPFYDEEGAVRYRLICRGGDDETLEPFGGLGSDYLWPLTCYLYPGDQEGGPSLLGEDPASMGFRGRGGFYPDELMGLHADYPELGRVRHFRARGFELTIEFINIVINPDIPNSVPDFLSAVEYADMKISLRREPLALTALSEAPNHYLECTAEKCELKEGVQPLMCRSPYTLSWEECTAGFEYDPVFWEINPYAIKRSEKAIERRRLQVERFSKDWASPSWPKDLVTETVDLVSDAARERKGQILQPLLPELPFLVLCGDPESSQSGQIQIKKMKEWNRLWKGMMEEQSFDSFHRLTSDDAILSSSYGVHILNDRLGIQKGLSVRTGVSCKFLRAVLEPAQ